MSETKESSNGIVVTDDDSASSEHIMVHELRKLVDTANAPIFGIDIHGHVNEWNFKTAEITGYSREEAFHKPLVSTFIAPKLRHSVKQILDHALMGKETSNYELEFETKSKETRYLLVNATTRRDANNNIVGVVGVAQDITEAAKHDRAVAAAAVELRQLVDTANAPIFGIDVHGNVNEWNEKTAEITGYSREEAIDKPLVSTFIAPNLRASVQNVLDRALRGKQTSNYELEFCTKSNEIRHLLVNATTRRDANYHIIGVVGVAQDVTEAAKHDRAVAAMANELRQLVDTANAPIFGIDIEGRVNEWNDKTAEITGFSKMEALNKPLVSTFIVPKFRESVQQVMDNALRGEETSNYELEFRTKSNEIRYLLVNATTRRDHENNISGVVGVAQDVTEAAKHDRAVAAMANELRQLVETANAPIFGIDVNGNVNEWNNKTAEITGFTKEEAMDYPLVETFIVPKLQQSVQEVMDNALKGKETSNYELEFRTKSNEIRYLMVNATTRRDPESNIIGVVGVAQDVTETKKHDRAVLAMANELRQLVDTANAPIFGIDVNGNVNEWNNKTAEITGFAKEEAVDKPLVSTFIVPKLRQAVQEVMDNALRGIETSNYELEFYTKSNEIRYLLVNATTRRDAENRIIGVVGVAQDVTETKKHDRAVLAMGNELRQLVDTANAPIFGIDVNGNVNEWNNKTAEITGYSKEEALNYPLISTFIVPKLQISVQEVMGNALKGEETSNYELEFRTKFNEIRYLLVNATTRRDPENNIVGVVGVAQDVTETKKNDLAVAAMANELRQLVDTANAPIFGIDVNGNVNEWNNKTAEITGFMKEEAFDKPLVSTFIVPKLRPAVQEVMDNALRGIETSNYELEFRTKSNEVRYLLVNATTRRDAERNIIGVVGVAQNVTETKKHDRAVAAMANELRQLVDTANAPIFGIDVNGNVNEWNDKTAEITGFSKKEAMNYPLVSFFIVPKLQRSVQEVMDNALKGIETSNYELEFRTKSNEVRYLLVNATTRRDADYNIVGVVGVAQDVTETKKHDRAVLAMANELRQLVDTANAPIFGIDVDGNVNEWNNKTAEITGYSKEEAMNNPLVSAFIVPKLERSVQEVMNNALKGKETSNYWLEFRTKSNEIRYLLVNATTRRDPENNIIGVVGVAQDVTETTKNDRAVAAMANELRQLVDTANAPIFGIDVNGNVNEWNNKTAEITGFTKEEAFDMPLVSTFIVKKLRQAVQEVMDNALRGVETSNYEVEFRTKSNEIRYLLVNATTRRDPENNIVGVVGVAQDVTETKKHDRAVAAMANELRQLVDTANAPIFGIDVNGNVNEWNNKTAEITEFTKEEAFNTPLVSTFIVKKLRPAVQEVMDNALKGKETSNYELEFRTKSNEIRYLLVNATTRRDPESNIIGVVGVAQDVTESARNARAVTAMANELRQLVDTANAPIFGIDVNGKVNEWNNKTAEITGFSKEEAYDKPLVSTFIVPKYRESVQEVLDNALKGNETSNYSLEFRTKSNETRYLVVNATTRRDPENNIVGVVGVAQDVTESSKNDRAIAAMAHELRQLVDTANAPIFGIDVNGNVNEWNNKTAEITEFPKEEAFNKPLVSTFIVPSLRKSVQEVLDKALHGDETSNYELEFETKSKEIRYLLVNATTRRDAENKIIGVVGVAQDVTESTKNDRAMSAMARELRQLVDTANAPIFGIDVDGDVNEWNDKTAEITGFSKEEAFDVPLVETFIVPSLRQSVQEVMDNALRGIETSNYELEFRTKSNEVRYLLVNATTRRDAENNIVGVVGVAQDVTEAARRDRAVTAMANELRQLVDTANAPIFGIDVNGNVNEWNNKTAEITGFTKEEAMSYPLVETFIVPKLRPAVQEVMDNALKGKETSNYELEFRTKSNEIRYLLVNATTRRDAEGNIIGVVGVAQDVTEAAKHDRAVAAMANELRQLIDTANAPIFGIDVDGDVNEWNDKTAEITGFSKEEAFDKPLVSTFIVPSLRQSVQEVLDNALKGRGTSNYELEFRTKSNEIRYLLVNATTRRDAENNIVGVVGVAQDVTEAAQHDRAVAAMARELRQLVDTANAPIFGIDVNGNVNEWNDRTAEITGFGKDEAFDKPLVSTFIVPKLRPAVQEVMDNALKGKETSNYELEFRTKSNEIRYLLVNATTRRDAENNIVGVVGVAQDVTEAAKHDRAVAAMANELRQLIDTANAPIFGIDVDGDVNEWNDKTAEITGFSKEEAFDKPLVSTFIVPSLRQSVQEVLDNALKGRGTSNYELEFRTKSNEIRYLLVNATTRRDAENNIVGVVGVAQDVTEAAQHDRAVAAMARELRQLVDTANAPIFGIDVNGNVNEWNDKTAEITGFSGDEAFNQPLVETFIVPKLRHSVQEVMDNALQGIETSNYELEFRTKSNEIRYLLVNATTRRDAENNIVGVVGVAQDVTEAAKHDRAVAAMANELRQLIDTANAPIFGIDVDGDVNEWNDKTAEITGFSKEEAFDKPLVSTFIVPSLRQSVQEVLDNALKGNETSNYELEFRTKSNEIRYLLVNATTRRDAENNIVGVVGVAQDVTEAAKHDRAVAAMANELRQLVDTANAPIFGIDINGNVNEWNNKTAEITGFTKEEAINFTLVETFIVPKLRPAVQEVMDNALKGKETSNYELEFRTKSNEIRYLLVNATTRRDAEGNIIGVVGVAQDVTEAAKHARAVTAMANELRQLVDTANAPIFGIDVHGNVNEWNNKTAEITGFTKEEAFSKPLVSTFIVPSLRPSVQEVLDKALHGNETSNYELEFETKSKEIRYLLVNATTRRDADYNIVGVVGVAQDVTDDRKHSQELREMQYIRASQEAKVETERNMTAYFAHELRNPLHAIDSALNSMPDGLPDVAQSLVDAMQLCTAFMSSIMNNLLDVRKMEEGKMMLNSAPICLESILNNVHMMLLPSVRPGVGFVTVCKTGEKGWVLGDSHRIQQVMTNVVTNAIKYTTSGSITLVIEWENENVRFECADTGPGIPVKEQKKLFERFVQRGGAPGTGLGLAIAKHLVDLTGGHICFHSDPTIKPGTSCVVKMPLPLCDPPEVIVKEDSNTLIEESLSFLLIDDVAMNRSMLSRRIKRGIAPSATITEASTGEEALVICGKEKFDVIVVDQYMEEAGGVMVGTDVVFAMRRMRIDSIIIGCSGNDMDDLFKEAGADWVWGKPMPSNKTTVKQLRTALAMRSKKEKSSA